MKQYDPLTELADHVSWYTKLRWVYIASLGVSWLGGNLIFIGWSDVIVRDTVLLLSGIIINATFVMILRRKSKNIDYYYRIAIALVTADVITASIVLYEHGGLYARTTILYGIPIFIAGALFGRRTLVYSIAAASVAYDFTLFMHAVTHGTLNTLTGDTLLLIAFYNTVFIMVGVVAKRSLDKTTASLKMQNTELREFNKAKDEFVSIASHQLRTPATAVKQYLGMLLDGEQLTQQQRLLAEFAFESNERQLKIVSDLLHVARIDAGKLKLMRRRTDLSALVAAVVDEQDKEFKTRNQRVHLEAPSKPVKATIDAKLVRMAVQNIVDNASKYSPAGKVVNVTLRPRNGDVDIVISDKGVGMTEKEQRRLFQKFTRVNSPVTGAAEGSGMGLYWAKKIVDLHGGTISIASVKRKGSAFTITLPRHLPAQRKPTGRPAIARP